MRYFGHDLNIETRDDQVSGGRLRELGRTRRFLQLTEVLPLLCDPVTKEPLQLAGSLLQSGSRLFPIIAGSPQLFPCDVERVAQQLRSPDALARFHQLTSLEQYCAFGMLRAAGDGNNLDPEDAWYCRHLWRSSRMLENVRGRFLDIGCDDAFLSRGMLADDVEYVGLEPSTSPSPAMRVAGFGEFLPFGDECFDAVGFQTSLDHIFDYHLAVAEAHRILRPGGRLYLATLLWTGVRAQLHTDTVHFHHFRPAQIESALAEQGFEVDQIDAYGWKNDSHRFGVYLSAVKR